MEDTELERAINQAETYLNARIIEEEANIKNLQTKLVPKLPAKKYTEYSIEIAHCEGAISALKSALSAIALAGIN